MKQTVTFKSGSVNLTGDLYLPDGADASSTYPAIVVGGPMATVKEQAAGVFANELSKRGFIALAFDYRGYGDSEGGLRQYEDPATKTEDIQNAVSFLRGHENVDSERIGALGVCASSSYIAAALASDRRVKAFGTVSAHFSLREFFTANPMVTPEIRDQLLGASNAARERYYKTGEATADAMVWPDMTGEEEGDFYQDIYDYYFRRVSSEWPNFSNHLVPFSLEQLVRSHALDYAPQITVPYLGVVGANAVTRPYTERFIEAKTTGAKDIKVIDDARHIQTYDRTEYVCQAADALGSFFDTHLSA